MVNKCLQAFYADSRTFFHTKNQHLERCVNNTLLLHKKQQTKIGFFVDYLRFFEKKMFFASTGS